MRDEESDAVRTVLQPLYQAYSGRYATLYNDTYEALTSMHC
jgi:hypothetical protein